MCSGKGKRNVYDFQVDISSLFKSILQLYINCKTWSILLVQGNDLTYITIKCVLVKQSWVLKYI